MDKENGYYGALILEVLKTIGKVILAAIVIFAVLMLIFMGKSSAQTVEIDSTNVTELKKTSAKLNCYATLGYSQFNINVHVYNDDSYDQMHGVGIIMVQGEKQQELNYVVSDLDTNSYYNYYFIISYLNPISGNKIFYSDTSSFYTLLEDQDDPVIDNGKLFIKRQSYVRENEDIPFEIKSTAFDVENKNGEQIHDYKINILPYNNYTVNDGLIYPTKDFYGDLYVRLYVTADEYNPSDTINFKVEINPLNDAPVLYSTEIIAKEDEPFIVSINDLWHKDVDNTDEVLQLFILDGDNYSVDFNTITTKANFYGELTVPMYLYDKRKYSDTVDITIIVENVNDPPEIINESIMLELVDTSYTLLTIDMFEIEDIDSDEFTLSIENLSGNSFSISGDTIRYLNDNNDMLKAVISDNDGATAETFILIQVTLTESSTGINELSTNINIYPNPVTDVLIIKSDEIINELKIIDSSGKLIKMSNPKSSDIILDVNGLPGGIYIMILNEFYVHKLNIR